MQCVRSDALALERNPRDLDAMRMAVEAGHVRAANLVVVGAMSAGLGLPPEA